MDGKDMLVTSDPADPNVTLSVCPQGGAQRTASMSSLNSQESSNDIGKLTDRQQAEYRTAYQEYIAQMAQLEMSGAGGGDRPVQPQPGQFLTPSEDKSRDGEVDGRKAFSKRSAGKPTADSGDFCSNNEVLDPITEEDEKGEHGSSRTPLTRRTSAERAGLFQGAELKLKASGGPRYQKLTSEDNEAEAEGGRAEATPPAKGKDFLSDAMLDKKESSDSGVRSSESSPNHSLQDEEAELSQLDRSNLIELSEDGPGARRLPAGLQDPAVVRMSICSEDQCSLLASSPEESWPSSKSFNLNRTPSNVTLNNNSNSQQPADATSTTSTRPGPNNENVRVVHLKRAMAPGEPPEICSMSCDTLAFGEERESIL